MIPKDFPKLLFQGTSIENSEQIKAGGLRFGSLVSTPQGCLDDRFYRGRMMVVKYDESLFQTELHPFSQYSIKENTGPNATITFNAMDTDSVMVSSETTTTRYVPQSEAASIELTGRQRAYLLLVKDIFNGSLCGEEDVLEMAKVKQVYDMEGLDSTWWKNDIPLPSRGAVYKYWNGKWEQGEKSCMRYAFSLLRRQAAADLLYLEVDDFKSVNTLNQKAAYFGNEETLLRHLGESFPLQIKFDWNNLEIDSDQLVKTAINQTYQSEVVRGIISLYSETGSLTDRQFFLPGPSIVGLEKLKADKK